MLLLLLTLAACKGPPKDEAPQADPVADVEEQDPLEEAIGVALWRSNATPLGGALKHDAGEGPRDPKKKGEFFVAPVPFRNPQIGWGLMVLGGYIFKIGKGEDAPPSTVALAGFASENESWGGFGGGQLFLGGDKWRIIGGVGGASINYDFYGIGNEGGDNDLSLPFSTEFVGGLVTVLGRIQPDVYLGPLAAYGASTTRIRANTVVPPELRPDAFDAAVATIGAQLQWDTRDNVFFPMAGHLLDLKLKAHDPAWGDSFNYQAYELQLRGYPALSPRSVLAWQFRSRLSSGDVPFYDLAQYDARGYVKGRYRDETMFSAEVEYRRDLWWRFGGVLFASAGQVAPDLGGYSFDNMLYAVGAGIRFQLTEKNPLNYRIDLAYGKNGLLFYFSVGEAF
ncbi:MAG: BamA/TamA family outer membrane protein [Planctomycetota bacterium]